MENKYLKYKLKYENLKNQLGGETVPDSKPRTQSWLYMPIILSPFTDIIVHFSGAFNKTINDHNTENPEFPLYSLEKIKNLLKIFYLKKNIDLNNHKELTKLEVSYDTPSFLHLRGTDQELILESARVKFIVDRLVDLFIDKNKRQKIIFHDKAIWIIPPYTESDKTISALENTEINCDQSDDHNKVIAEFRMKYNDVTKAIKYDYKCIGISKDISVNNKSTANTAYNNGNIIYLENHEITCNPDQAISNIKFTKIGDQIKYDYKCKTVGNLRNITEYNTTFTENIDVSSLKDQYIKCPNNGVLNYVNLVKNPTDNRIRYKYKCGHLPDHINFKELIPDDIYISPGERNVPTMKTLDDANIDFVFRKATNQIYNNYLLICFGGHSENLRGIYKAGKFEGNIIICCDRSNAWYENVMDNYINIINDIIKKNNIDKITMIGQSMGGYAVLYASCFIDNAIVLSFSPQTFYRDPSKISTVRPTMTWGFNNKVKDIREMLIQYPNNSIKYIFTAKSECDSFYNKNPPNNMFWNDSIFAGYLYNIDRVSIIIVNKNKHPIYEDINPVVLYTKIYTNYDNLVRDVKSGTPILIDSALFFSDR
jgi:hypothetical protein